MIYRIDLQHFLIHAIDHFSLQDLTSMEYCIISAKIPNGGKVRNVIKMNDLYPSPDTVIAYAETHDKNVLKKMYIDTMFPKHKKGEPETSTFTNIIYQTFINTLLQRQNVMIVCDELENPYIDCLCDYLKDEYEEYALITRIVSTMKTPHYGIVYCVAAFGIVALFTGPLLGLFIDAEAAPEAAVPSQPVSLPMTVPVMALPSVPEAGYV